MITLYDIFALLYVQHKLGKVTDSQIGLFAHAENYHIHRIIMKVLATFHLNKPS